MNEPKWTLPEASSLSRMTYGAVRDQLRSGDLTKEQVDALAKRVEGEHKLEAGRPLLAAAEISVADEPDRYVLRADFEAAQAAADDLSDLPEGVIGVGDNVFQTDDFEGEVLVLRQVSEIERLLEEGVPEGVVGVIDDSGGTLTAPILPEFDAVICRAGTVRSHLAIIAREFGVPVLMGTRMLREPVNGERIRVRYSVPAQNPDAYHGGELGERAHIEVVA